jgi:hypothetical protein
MSWHLAQINWYTVPVTWAVGRGLRVGGSGKPPFWRTLEEFCKGLGPVTLKINTQHTPPEDAVYCVSLEKKHVQCTSINRKGMIRPPVVPGGQGIGLGSRKPRESGSVIGADRRRSGPSCVLAKGVYWVPSAQRRCCPEEALYLPTFSHLLIVNKLLSLTHTHTHK